MDNRRQQAQDLNGAQNEETQAPRACVMAYKLRESNNEDEQMIGKMIYNRLAEECLMCAGLGHHIGKCPLIKEINKSLKHDKIGRKVWGDYKSKFKQNGKQKCIKETSALFKRQYEKDALSNLKSRRVKKQQSKKNLRRRRPNPRGGPNGGGRNDDDSSSGGDPPDPHLFESDGIEEAPTAMNSQRKRQRRQVHDGQLEPAAGRSTFNMDMTGQMFPAANHNNSTQVDAALNVPGTQNQQQNYSNLADAGGQSQLINTHIN